MMRVFWALMRCLRLSRGHMLVLSVVVALLMWAVRGHAATVGPATLFYTAASPTGYATVQGACERAIAEAGGGGVLTDAQPYCTVTWYGTTWLWMNAWSAATSCPTGFVLRSDTGQCSNVNTVAGAAAPGAGDCSAGKDQQMQVNPTANGNAALNVEYGGCKYVLSQARSCQVNGVDKICGVYTSTGDVAAGASGTVAGSSSVPPMQVGGGGACPSSQIWTIVSNVVTCIAGTETKPALVSTGGQNAAGDPIQVTQKCVGDACTQVTTTGGASPSTVSGAVAAGSGAGQSSAAAFPGDYEKDATGQAANAKLDVLHNDLLTLNSQFSAVASTDPTAATDTELSDAFFKTTFTGLLAWRLPTKTVTCPTFAFPLPWGHAPITLDSHCQFLESARALFNTIFPLIFAVAALFVVLAA